MKQQTLGKAIAMMRKEKNMTQAELAEKMGVTDKAVSKWERDLSCPDVATLPRLAELFGITVDELMQGKSTETERDGVSEIISLITRAVALAMGVSVTVLCSMKRIDLYSAVGLLGIGLTAVGISLLLKKD